MISIKDIVDEIEKFAPTAYQESYDNSGLITGDPETEAKGVLLCFDVTEKIVDEAICKNLNMIVSHHPVIFYGLKRLTGKTPTERIIIKAVKNDAAIYCAHTNLDSVSGGISTTLARKLGLEDIKILSPKQNRLLKLSVFAPCDHAETVRSAMFAAGAGTIGKYDCCSYNTEGYGTFRAGEGARPFVGTSGEYHREPETLVQILTERSKLNDVLKAMLSAHPYEVPAYDIFALENKLENVGLGAVGNLPEALSCNEFFDRLKNVLDVKCLRHSHPAKDSIRRVAVCGGSGTELLSQAVSSGADVFVTGNCKYHQFADFAREIISVDAGHFETECFAVEIFYDLIHKKFPNFAVCLSEHISNPILYY